MWRRFHCFILSVASCLVVIAGCSVAKENRPAPASSVTRLIDDYRKAEQAEAKVRLLQKIAGSKDTNALNFLEEEYNNLDSSTPEEARLLGVIFLAWARQPTEDTLHYLLYEGLFHDDPNVVQASAGAVAGMGEESRAIMSIGHSKKGKDPSEDLASDFIDRMIGRPEFILSIERALVLLSRQPRPDYKPTGRLDEKLDAAAQTAALDHWKNWFEKRYGRKFVPEAASKP